MIAGELSRDKQIIEDILNGKDIHRQTGSIIFQKDKDLVTSDERNSVKPHTFAPLYFAGGMNELPHIKKYYEEFFNIYSGHKLWQIKQMDDVLKYGQVQTPSGRQYAFPGTRRINSERTSNATKIVNYSIQGYATGDIVPLACIRTLREFKRLNLKSKLILTVHDSIVVDCYPGEELIVYKALHWAMTEIASEIKERWNYEMLLPLKSETSIGDNWMELETYHGE